MKPENRETTTIELAAAFYVRKRKYPFFEIFMQCCTIPRNCRKCCKNPLHLQVNSYGIEYVEELKILGIIFNRNNDNITTINITNKLPSIEKEILQWKSRHLTLIGKITVAKALLLSKLVHIFISLPNPTKSIIAKIDTLFYKFIWNDKNDRAKRTKVIQGPESDGLNMVYLHGFIKSMKISWIERLYKSSHEWLLIAEQSIPSLEGIQTYGSGKLQSIKRHIHNPFWKDAIDAWAEFIKLYKPNAEQLVTEKLWFTDVSKYRNSIIKKTGT